MLANWVRMYPSLGPPTPPLATNELVMPGQVMPVMHSPLYSLAWVQPSWLVAKPLPATGAAEAAPTIIAVGTATDAARVAMAPSRTRDAPWRDGLWGLARSRRRSWG